MEFTNKKPTVTERDRVQGQFLPGAWNVVTMTNFNKKKTYKVRGAFLDRHSAEEEYKRLLTLYSFAWLYEPGEEL